MTNWSRMTAEAARAPTRLPPDCDTPPWMLRERLGRGGNPTFAHCHDSGCTASQYGTGVVIMPAAVGGRAPGWVSPLGGRARW